MANVKYFIPATEENKGVHSSVEVMVKLYKLCLEGVKKTRGSKQKLHIP